MGRELCSVLILFGVSQKYLSFFRGLTYEVREYLWLFWSNFLIFKTNSQERPSKESIFLHGSFGIDAILAENLVSIIIIFLWIY